VPWKWGRAWGRLVPGQERVEHRYSTSDGDRLPHATARRLVQKSSSTAAWTSIAIADDKAVEQALEDFLEDLRNDITVALDAYGDPGYKEFLTTEYEKYPAFAGKSRLRRHAKKTASRNSEGAGRTTAWS